MSLDEFLLDLTFNINGTNKDLLRMIVKDSNGQKFIGNVRVILSLQHCVHARMYTKTVINFYGEVGFSHHRLALTDDDVSEWGPLEDCIATRTYLHGTKHVICRFHVRTLVSFQTMYPKIPRVSYANNSKLMVEGEQSLQSKEDKKYASIATLEEQVSHANTKGGVNSHTE